MSKGAEEKINEDVLRWFGHVERMENNRIAKRVYVGKCAGSCSVARPKKGSIDTVNNCLRKRGLDVSEANKMMQIGVNGGGL